MSVEVEGCRVWDSWKWRHYDDREAEQYNVSSQRSSLQEQQEVCFVVAADGDSTTHSILFATSFVTWTDSISPRRADSGNCEQKPALIVEIQPRISIPSPRIHYNTLKVSPTDNRQ